MIELARIVLTVLVAPMGMDVAAAQTVGLIPMTWRIEQETDAVSGDRRCFVVSRGGDVIARLLKQRQAKAAAWSVMIGFDGQPGSVRYIRINRKYFTTAEERFHGSEASEIVELLKSPGEFAFEWARGPDYVKQQGLFGTGDFAAKAAECEGWIDQGRSARAAPPGIAALGA